MFSSCWFSLIISSFTPLQQHHQLTKVLLPNCWIIFGHSRQGDRLPDVGPSLARFPIRRGWDNPIMTIFNIIFYRSPDAASSRRATWSTGLRKRGTWIPHLAQWVISVPSFHIESIQFVLALLQAKREELDLEGSVCAKSSTSLQILPHKTNVMARSLFSSLSSSFLQMKPAALHLCSKFSGKVKAISCLRLYFNNILTNKVASYSDKKKFDSITRYLSAR